MSKYLDPKFWKDTNFVDEPELHPARKLTDNELTRRQKISMTSQFKYETDPEFREIKQQAVKKGAEQKRKIPLQDYAHICTQLWQPEVKDRIKLAGKIAKKYNVEHGILEKIMGNFENCALEPDVYEQLKTAWFDANPDHWDLRTKKMHNSRDNVAIGKKISETKNGLTDEQALEVYERCKPYWKQQGAVEFQKQLAKEYGVSAGKIKNTMMGVHPALENVDTSWQYTRYGRVILTTPEGEVNEFEHILDAIEYMDTFDHGVKDIYRFAIEKIRNLEPHTPTMMQRRFWKRWIFERKPLT